MTWLVWSQVFLLVRANAHLPYGTSSASYMLIHGIWGVHKGLFYLCFSLNTINSVKSNRNLSLMILLFYFKRFLIKSLCLESNCSLLCTVTSSWFSGLRACMHKIGAINCCLESLGCQLQSGCSRLHLFIFFPPTTTTNWEEGVVIAVTVYWCHMLCMPNHPPSPPP